MKKLLAFVLAAVMLLSFNACGEEFKVKTDADFEAWFNQSLVPAYDAYVNSPSVDENAYPSISLMLASDAYINYVFDYICDGVYPENGELIDDNGVYTYAYNEFKQVFEFDADKRAVKVTMYMEMMGESRTEFVAVFTENKDEFFIQYLMPTFGEYFEVRFNEEGDSFMFDDDCYELPYDIFISDIPESFAKETE